MIGQNTFTCGSPIAFSSTPVDNLVRYQVQRRLSPC